MPLTISYFAGERDHLLYSHIASEPVALDGEYEAGETPSNAGVAVLVSDELCRIEYGGPVKPTSQLLLPNVERRVMARPGVKFSAAGDGNLYALELSNYTVQDDAEVSDVVGAILNISSGSAVTITDDADGAFDIDSGNIVVDAALTAGEHQIVLRETLVSADNNPRDTTLTITVTEAPEEE